MSKLKIASLMKLFGAYPDQWLGTLADGRGVLFHHRNGRFRAIVSPLASNDPQVISSGVVVLEKAYYVTSHFDLFEAINELFAYEEDLVVFGTELSTDAMEYAAVIYENQSGEADVDIYKTKYLTESNLQFLHRKYNGFVALDSDPLFNYLDLEKYLKDRHEYLSFGS
jgi:hypothetical protein